MIEYPLCIERLTDDDNGDSYISKGHHDKEPFIHDLMIELEEDGTLGWYDEGFVVNPDDITLTYMKVIHAEENGDQWGECNPSIEGAFPVTYWDN